MHKTRVLVTVLLLLGLTSAAITVLPASAQIQAVRALNVYDAKGLKVGKVLETGTLPGGAVIVAFKAGGIPFTLILSNGGTWFPPFWGWGDSRLRFLESGCNGTAYVGPVSVGPLGLASVIRPNASVYLADPQAIPTVLVPLSHITYEGVCVNSEEPPAPLVPALYVGDLIPRFAPPFTVR